MKPTTDELIDDDPRIVQAAREYLAELESGRAPNRAAYVARFPELAAALVECFDSIEFAHHSARAIHPNRPVPQAEYPANPLGDFQIVREIGRGGMGVVYEAVQLSLGRRVALKVLPFASALDDKHLQRFKTEAAAAAQLHHTNIVPVYYVGHERGVHFYAMQLIDGRSLDSVIDELRADEAGLPVSADASTSEFRAGPTAASAARSSPRTSRDRERFRTAARIAAQVADALEYAHDAGVIHRDIKPANLLLDGKGTLWVTDFGLAQVSADLNLTQTGSLIGTLRYMSPEQASGRRTLVDQRTDVYSLGATLYELLTLQPLFSGQDRQTLLQQILNDEPRPLRQVDRSIPVELETIVLKSLAKSPADRYATAGEMAADLRRFLEERPILARRPSVIDRVRKWSRRHPSVVIAAGILLAICTAGLLVSNWMIAREQAKTQAALTNEKQRTADARRAIDLLVDVSEEELAEQWHMQGVRKRLLQTALDYYQDFLDSHKGDAAAQAELEAGKQRVRNILVELATLEGASLLFLAADPSAQDDLQVSPAQKTRIAELKSRSREQHLACFREPATMAAESRRQKLYELAKAQETELSDILRPSELQRLRQIELQVQGPRAFHDSYAVEKLKLTAEQRRKIRQFKDEAMAALSFGPADGNRGDDSSRFLNFERVQKAEVKAILGILTPEQTAIWEQLTGKPFKGTLMRPPPGIFGPRGPDGPPPGGPPRPPPDGRRSPPR